MSSETFDSAASFFNLEKSLICEVYYHGNVNPERRRLTYNVRPRRRSLQGDEGLLNQNNRLTDTFGVTPRSSLSWCNLDSQSAHTFRLDVAMDSLDLPRRHNVAADVNALRLSMMQHIAGATVTSQLWIQLCASEDRVATYAFKLFETTY